ncbi:MAG: alcohol dehydrogenase catalytic domain-containing protein, partial [Bacillota bacterium]
MTGPTMKAAVLHGPGRIVVENVPVPTLGPGEALVAVRAAGICGSDVPRMKRAEIPRLPLVLGHEFAGEVVRVSEGAGPVNPGDRVVVIPLIPCGRCDLCQAGEFAMCENYDYLGSRRD